MKWKFIILSAFLASCTESKVSHDVDKTIDVKGTWQLLTAKNITGSDTTFTDYTINMKGIKTIGKTHFSFFQHDLSKGADSTAMFAAGAGKYSLEGNQYTEFLEYCTAREWEDNQFEFTLEVKGDTLLQTGIEKIESLGVDRKIIETYVRIK